MRPEVINYYRGLVRSVAESMATMVCDRDRIAAADQYEVEILMAPFHPEDQCELTECLVCICRRLWLSDNVLGDRVL